MDAQRRKQLKLQGKAEVERRSAQHKARSDALLPDMMAALSHDGALPPDPTRLNAEQRARYEKELWVRKSRPTIHKRQLDSDFIPLPDTKGQWKNHALSYFMCKGCNSVLPAIPPRRPIYSSSCACGNLSWFRIFGLGKLSVREPSKLLPIALFGRAGTDG